MGNNASCCNFCEPCYDLVGLGKYTKDDDTLLMGVDDSEEFHSVYSQNTAHRRRRSRASSIVGESDMWHDALMEHDWIVGEETFEVTDEELHILKEHLAEKFPGADANYLSDAYIRSVASKPYSKNMSIRRPLEVRKSRIYDETF